MTTLTYRRYQSDDTVAITALYRASDVATGDEHRMDVDKLRMLLGEPVIDVSQDTFVIERDGQIIAFAYCEFDPDGHCYADVIVHPDYRRQGLGTELLRLTEARTLERGQADLAPDLPILLMRVAGEHNQSAIHLLEHAGYPLIRSFYQMRIALDQPIDLPLLSDGLTIRRFDPADTEAVYAAHVEAFDDHWEYEHRTFEQWQQQVLNRLGQDPSLWLIAYDGDQVAGICLNRPYGADDQQLAWVGSLGVRRNWRKHGLGFALLMHSFALFRSRGFTRAGLNVDGSSLTNAVALYERAGMRIYKRALAYRKTLRGADTAD
jgi:mycothiol synthase